MKHLFFIIHNTVAHPLLILKYLRWPWLLDRVISFHDWTAKYMRP
jgi:hypothetical protein